MRTVPTFLLVMICLVAGPAPWSAAGERPGVPGAVPAAWGPLPAPADSVTARPQPPPGPPAWKVALRVPKYVVGAPLWVVDRGLKGVVRGLDALGAFRFTEQVLRGFRDPLGNFWLPDAAYGDREGLELGAIVQRPDVPLPGMRAKGRVAASSREAFLFSLGALAPLGPRSWVELGGGSQIRPSVDYYARGLASPPDPDDPAVYSRDTDWAGLGWRQHLGGPLEFTAHGFYAAVEASPSDDADRDETIEALFPRAVPHGYGLTSSGLTGQLRLIYDDTDQTGRPAGGRRGMVLVQAFAPTDGTDSGHWTVGASLEHFLGLGLPQRTLAVKGWWLRQHAVGDDPIPFTRLLRNATPHQLRGYSTARFHATGMAGASVEYRWPVWIHNDPRRAGVDAYLFADAGQPYERAGELAWRNVFWSGGLGLRAIDFGGDFSLRVELGVGREGGVARISGSQVFQDLKAGFFDGREPLPLVR